MSDTKPVNELCPACGGDGVVEGEQEVRERMCLCEGGRGPHGELPCSRCGGSAVIVELVDPLMLCPVCEGDGGWLDGAQIDTGDNHD